MDEIKEELDNISYRLWQNYELMRILNLAIEDNLETGEPLSVINLSEIIECQLKTLNDELGNVASKVFRLD